MILKWILSKLIGILSCLFHVSYWFVKLYQWINFTEIPFYVSFIILFSFQSLVNTYSFKFILAGFISYLLVQVHTCGVYFILARSSFMVIFASWNPLWFCVIINLKGNGPTLGNVNLGMLTSRRLKQSWSSVYPSLTIILSSPHSLYTFK